MNEQFSQHIYDTHRFNRNHIVGDPDPTDDGLGDPTDDGRFDPDDTNWDDGLGDPPRYH